MPQIAKGKRIGVGEAIVDGDLSLISSGMGDVTWVHVLSINILDTMDITQ